MKKLSDDQSWTGNLKVMSLTNYHCSTSHYVDHTWKSVGFAIFFHFSERKKKASSLNYFYDFENDIFYRQGKSIRQWFVYCISCQSKQCRIAFSRKIIYKSVMPPRLQIYNNRSKWSLRNIHSLSLYIQKQRKFLSVQHETRTSKHTRKLLNHVKQVK